MLDWSAETITRALAPCRLGRHVLYFPQVGSTNEVAHRAAAEGAGDGLLVIADEQTAGRGRFDRAWWAPPRSCLLMSLLLRPRIPLRLAGQLTMCVGLGAVEGIEQVTGLRTGLKWPNDLVLQGRKLAGMLSELRADPAHLEYAVIGLGLNVNVDFRTPGAAPVIAELSETATSLSMALGQSVDRLDLLRAILGAVGAWYDRVEAGESIHRAWAEHLDTLGRHVTVTQAAGQFHGQATGVTPEGGLILREDTGNERIVWSGDVATLRTAGGSALPQSRRPVPFSGL